MNVRNNPLCRHICREDKAVSDGRLKKFYCILAFH